MDKKEMNVDEKFEITPEWVADYWNCRDWDVEVQDNGTSATMVFLDSLAENPKPHPFCTTYGENRLWEMHHLCISNQFTLFFQKLFQSDHAMHQGLRREYIWWRDFGYMIKPAYLAERFGLEWTEDGFFEAVTPQEQ